MQEAGADRAIIALPDRGHTRKTQRDKTLEIEQVALVSGSYLGPYEISGPLGAGGMGEVYRARDTRLGRDVAIKVLPESFAHDPERRARFEREARVLAGLSHPHIAVVHGLERVAAEGSERSADALVMELVEGPTLAERLESGPLAVDEALGIARQVAAALEAAHEHGIVHRDLKPANVKLRPDGTVKVLDFGLAKSFAGEAASSGLLHSRTLSMTATGVGQVLGTAAYMPPEQARGNGVDRSVDLWAFGCVLYEMLAGQRAFPGDDATEIIAAVLKSNPDWTQLPAETPATVRMLLGQCLRKQPRERLGDARAARLMLEDAGAKPGVAHEPAGRPAPYRRAVVWVLSGIAVAASGAFLADRWASGPTADAARPVVRFDIVPAGLPLPTIFVPRNLAIAPDGSRIAYTSGGELWMRPLDQPNAVVLRPGGGEPFFSPDGTWVATLGGGGGLQKVPVAGGTAVPLAGEGARTRGGTWSAGDTIVFATAVGLFRVPAGGGTVERLLTPASDREELRFAWPLVSPDGRHSAFTILREGDVDGSDIAVLDLATREYRVIVRGGFAARYVPTGHLIYAVNGRLRAVGVNESFDVLGDPFPIAGVELPLGLAGANFDVSASGTLVYRGRTRLPFQFQTIMVWVDRDGREEAVQADPGSYNYPRMSPDGSRVALEITSGSRDIWVLDLERGGMTRLTDGPTEDLMSAWSADGRRVFFASDAEGPFKVYSRAADASSPARLEFEGPENYMPLSAADPARLVVRIHTPPAGDVAILHLDEPHRLEPLLASSRYNIVNAQVSPDGRWIAYQSDESGQDEVYVRSFPDIDRRRELVSRGGGTQPLWGPTGSGELYYRTLDGGVAVAAVELEPDLSVGVPRELFPNRGYGTAVGNAWNYAVSPRDGRFLMLKDAEPAQVRPIRVVVNWIEEFKRQIAAR